jgi:hypothetical protein
MNACRTAYLGAAASMFSTASGVASSRPRAAAGFLGAGLGAALALAGRLAGAAGRLGAATGRLYRQCKAEQQRGRVNCFPCNRSCYSILLRHCFLMLLNRPQYGRNTEHATHRLQDSLLGCGSVNILHCIGGSLKKAAASGSLLWCGLVGGAPWGGWLGCCCRLGGGWLHGGLLGLADSLGGPLGGLAGVPVSQTRSNVGSNMVRCKVNLWANLWNKLVHTALLMGWPAFLQVQSNMVKHGQTSSHPMVKHVVSKPPV